MRIGERESPKISVTSQKPGRVQSMCSQPRASARTPAIPDTDFSPRFRDSDLFNVFSGLDRSSEHRDNITAGAGSISPATCHQS